MVPLTPLATEERSPAILGLRIPSKAGPGRSYDCGFSGVLDLNDSVGQDKGCIQITLNLFAVKS